MDRLTRVNELLKREIAELLFRVMSERDFDPAAVTVTQVQVSSNLRQAHVRVSVMGDEKKKYRLLNLILKHRKDIQRGINRDMKIKYTPHLFFELDDSIEEGDRILSVISHMENEGILNDDSRESQE